MYVHPTLLSYLAEARRIDDFAPRLSRPSQPARSWRWSTLAQRMTHTLLGRTQRVPSAHTASH